MGAFNVATGLADDPAKNQANAAASSLDWQKQMFEETRKDMAPWMQSGEQNLNRLNTAMGQGGPLDPMAQFKFSQNDPSYQWRLSQGVDALKAGGAAAGNLGSGNMGVALMNYGQNAASQEYGNEFNRWMGQRGMSYNMLAGLANPSAAQQMGNFSMQAGANMGNTMQTGAMNTLAGQQFQAGNMQGSLNALGNIGQSIYKNYQQGQLYDQYQNNMAYQNYGVNPVDYGGGGTSQGVDMYAGDLWA